MPLYPVHAKLARLRETGEITIDGVSYRRSYLDGPWLQPGDLYVAGRNTGPHLLTVQSVDLEPGHGWVNPVAGGSTPYPFDLHECIGVVLNDVDYLEYVTPEGGGDID